MGFGKINLAAVCKGSGCFASQLPLGMSLNGGGTTIGGVCGGTTISIVGVSLNGGGTVEAQPLALWACP